MTDPSEAVWQPPRRYEQLDALRGVAAFVVFIGHLYHLQNPVDGTGLWTTALSPYVTGPSAVILFFVLSGFVLSIPFIERRNQRYLPYATRRFFRLFVPFAFAIIVSLGFAMIVGPHYAATGVADLTPAWRGDIGAGLVARHLLMLGWPAAAEGLNPPAWSLIIEMRASLLLPLVFLVVLRFRWIAVGTGFILTIIAAKLKFMLGDPSAISAATALGSLLLTARYIGFFGLGAMCALSLPNLLRMQPKIPPIGHVLVVAMFFAVAQIVVLRNRENYSFVDIFYGLMSAYLICLSISSLRLARILRHKWLAYLGKISFSLYLIHVPIIMLIATLTGTALTGLWWAVVAVPCVLLAATAMEKWVEQPSHEAGKQVSRWLERRRAS